MALTARTMDDDADAFLRMAQDFPVRTAIFTFGLPAFALLQWMNGILHGGSLPLIGVFSAVAIACSVVLTRYQVAIYRRKRVTRSIE